MIYVKRNNHYDTEGYILIKAKEGRYYKSVAYSTILEQRDIPKEVWGSLWTHLQLLAPPSPAWIPLRDSLKTDQFWIKVSSSEELWIQTCPKDNWNTAWLEVLNERFRHEQWCHDTCQHPYQQIFIERCSWCFRWILDHMSILFLPG